MLAKTKLNTVEVLVSKALIDSNIRQWWICVSSVSLWQYVQKEHDDMKEEIKNSLDK